MRPNASLDPGPGRAILVPQTSFLGDVVLTTPLLVALRERLRPARMVALVRPEAQALLDGHPALDAVMVDDKHGADGGIRGSWRVARRLRREGFDLAVSPHRSWRTAAILAASGIPRRVGFASARGAAVYQARIKRDLSRHDVDRNMALVGAFGPVPPAPPMFVPVKPAAAARAEAVIPGGSGPLVGIAPGSVWPTKRWSVDGFAAVCAAVTRRGGRCVILGAPSERDRAEAVAAMAGGTATVLAGTIDLATAVAVIDRLDVLVTNDSAPMHIGCARGVPVVAVFCATTPAFGYGPWGSGHRVVQADLACRPCARHGGRHCPRGTEDCIHLVDTADVIEAVMQRAEGWRA